MNIFTIGFTKKTAQQFFELIKNNKIKILIDIRLNNTSQLASFSKYPDIQYFLDNLCECKYIHDTQLAPTEKILKDYKSKIIDWNGYVVEFEQLMESRLLNEYIEKEYINYKSENICLLCSEELPAHCHRSLIASVFESVHGGQTTNL